MSIKLVTPADDSLADETAGHADLLATDYYDLLVVEQLLGDDRGKAAEHVVVRVHHDALGAHAGAGHPSRRYPCPHVPTLFLLNFLLNSYIFKKIQNFGSKLYTEYSLCQYFLQNLSFIFYLL
jgi:hypothetical protein